MIDGIKCLGLPIRIKDILSNPFLDWSQNVSVKTGDMTDRPQIALYMGMIFTIKNNKYCNVRGSIHKYANPAGNFNNLNYERLISVIKDLESKFCINANVTKLDNIEFAVNITSDLPPGAILDSIVDYKGTTFNRRKEDGMYYLECKKQRYIIKTYDKGLQYGQDTNIWRFEVKVIKMEHLKGIGIRTIGDLIDKTKLLKLGKLLQKHFDQIFFYDTSIDLSTINQTDAYFLTKGRNFDYWENFRKTNPENYYKKRRRYKEHVIKYANRDLSHILSTMIWAKWTELLNPISSQKLDEWKKRGQEIQQPPQTEINYRNKGLIPVHFGILCKECGKNIEHKKRGARFCSKKCKNDYTNKLLNPANNLKRRLAQIATDTLFDTCPFIQLSQHQKELLQHRNSIYN